MGADLLVSDGGRRMRTTGCASGPHSASHKADTSPYPVDAGT